MRFTNSQNIKGEATSSNLVLFIFMATLFKRLTHYCTTTGSKMLSQEQRAELGRIVCANFIAFKKPTDKVHTHTYENEFGSFKVICYPKTFVPTVDRIISNYYKDSQPKGRKRIPSKKPVFSTRKSA